MNRDPIPTDKRLAQFSTHELQHELDTRDYNAGVARANLNAFMGIQIGDRVVAETVGFQGKTETLRVTRLTPQFIETEPRFYFDLLTGRDHGDCYTAVPGRYWQITGFASHGDDHESPEDVYGPTGG